MSAETKCDNDLIERVRAMLEAGLSWPRIAKAAGVAEKSLANYHKVGHNSYNADFAAMVEEAQDEFASGRTKAGQFIQSCKHKLKKVIKERKVTKCPRMPPASYSKELLIDYADEELQLVLTMAFTKDEMHREMELRIVELIEYGEPHYVVEDVVVRIEETEVDPSPPAVKNVLSNAGKKEKRWLFTEQVDLGININALKDEECEEVRDLLKKNVG